MIKTKKSNLTFTTIILLLILTFVFIGGIGN